MSEHTKSSPLQDVFRRLDRPACRDFPHLQGGQNRTRRFQCRRRPHDRHHKGAPGRALLHAPQGRQRKIVEAGCDHHDLFPDPPADPLHGRLRHAPLELAFSKLPREPELPQNYVGVCGDSRHRLSAPRSADFNVAPHPAGCSVAVPATPPQSHLGKAPNRNRA